MTTPAPATPPGSTPTDPGTQPVTPPAPRIDNADALQSLLKSIKRDLKDAAQI